MKKKQVVLELLPESIDLVIHDGSRFVESRQLPLELEDDAGEWSKAIRRTAVSLRAVVNEIGVAGSPTRVLYRSPTQAIDLSSFAVRLPAQALEAGTMSCADSLPYSAMTAVTESAIIGRDGSGENRQTHVLSAADREDTAEAIAFLVEESGLDLRSATPMDAAVVAGFVGRELEDATRRGSLYVGEQTSHFVAVSDACLLFSRRIDLGVGALAASLTRPILTPGRGDTIELDPDAARAVLDKFGVPDRDDVVHETLGLSGGQVIPLLQPVLQRFVVELRQSLRFGVSEEDRDGLKIHVSGPGASVRNFADVIGRELEIETVCTPSPEPEMGSVELADAMRDPAVLERLNLLPRKVSANRRTGRLRRWLYTGASTAVLLIAADGVRQHMRVRAARVETDIYAAQIKDLEALEATGAQLGVVMGARNQLEQIINDEIGLTNDHYAYMQELSRITPESIRLMKMTFTRAVGRTSGTIRGVAFESPTEPGRTELESFIESLQASPLFDGVDLGTVQMGATAEREGQRFQASFLAIATPPGVGREGQVAAGDANANGGTPE